MTSLLLFFSFLGFSATSTPPAIPAIDDKKLCKAAGYDNWSRVVKEKGKPMKVECYDHEWRMAQLIISQR